MWEWAFSRHADYRVLLGSKRPSARLDELLIDATYDELRTANVIVNAVLYESWRHGGRAVLTPTISTGFLHVTFVNGMALCRKAFTYNMNRNMLKHFLWERFPRRYDGT